MLWKSDVVARALRHVRAQLDLLVREHTSSGRLGVAVGVGVLLGCSPFLGFQTLLGLAAGHLFRLNRLAILFGLQISVPPLTPLVLFATAQTGALLLHGHWLPLRLAAFQGKPTTAILASLFLDMLVGGALVGGVLAIVLGTLSAFGLWWLRGARSLTRAFRPEQWAEMRARLQRLPRVFRTYAYWKLRLDPVYLLVLAEVPLEGELLDLGTGIGLLPLMLSLLRPALRVRGVEWDARRVDVARQLLSGLTSASIEEANACAYPIGSPACITMLDILHYSPLPDAQRWLEACAGALRPGGVLLIRELEPGHFAVAPWLERVSVRLRWNRGGGVYAPPSSEIARDLTSLGLTVVRRPAGLGLFRDNTLTIARRPSLPDGR
jgi:uncharacterized protein (DUF2062 family)/2-polyprenyl-3-methyl-5-hydroxy-6-metoxy-1,4-benzoquinol methylase